MKFMEVVMVTRARGFLGAVLLSSLLAGCGGGGGGGGLDNNDPGLNDLNVVVAFGDSLTQGSECSCTSYPDRLASLIAKTVVNTGVSGTLAAENVGRVQSAIDRFHPAFMLILYGVNDLIHGADVTTVGSALDQMVEICKQNNVVPVLATYPEPILDHVGFALRTLTFNQHIREIASARDIRCVDLEAEFGADPLLYEADGLHPNDAGTQIMALAFADLF